MAITGTGTKDDPYIVHNYDELKEKYTEGNESSIEWYIKLVNDIDCNDLGDDWEWTAMPRGYGNKHIDLDGHTIKNIMIKSGSSLFSDKNGSTYISNGKILNVFNNGAVNIFNGVTLNDISISVNGTGVTDIAFVGSRMTNCALYYKTAKLNNYIATCYHQEDQVYFKNCDLWFDVFDVNEKTLAENTNRVISYSRIGFENCRMRGTIKGIPAGFDGSSYGGDYSGKGLFNRAYCNNCVIEMDTTGLVFTADYQYLLPIFRTLDGTNSIINKDKMSDRCDLSNKNYACTTSQMRDADYLNSIGFNVVKVGG